MKRILLDIKTRFSTKRQITSDIMVSKDSFVLHVLQDNSLFNIIKIIHLFLYIRFSTRQKCQKVIKNFSSDSKSFLERNYRLHLCHHRPTREFASCRLVDINMIDFVPCMEANHGFGIQNYRQHQCQHGLSRKFSTFR